MIEYAKFWDKRRQKNFAYIDQAFKIYNALRKVTIF